MAATPTFAPDYSFLNLPLADELEVLTDELELALNGGQSTDDSAYPRTFLRLCMEQAKDKLVAETETANLGILQQDYLLRKKDEQDSYFLDLKAKSDYWETPDRWIQAYPIVFLYDDERGQDYFLLPTALVQLRRYQNLPTEWGIRDIQARNVLLRERYRFAYASQGSRSFRHGPGGTLGRFMFTIEQHMAAATGEQYRCYIEAPKFDVRLPADKRFDMFTVIRDDRTSQLPAPALRLVTRLDMMRYAMDLALLRTRPDKLVDNSPTPTTAAQ